MKLIGMLDSPYVRRTAVSLVCDDGEVLMDSTLILQYAEATKANGRSLWPGDPAELQHDLRAVGLALAACEKSVQIVYERNLRPAEAQHEPWVARVTGQLLESIVPAEVHRGLAALSVRMEATPQFIKYPPDGPGVQRGN